MTKTYQSLMEEATEAYENIKRITEAMDELATAVKEPKRKFQCNSSCKDYFNIGSPDPKGCVSLVANSADGDSSVRVILSKEDQRELIKTLQEGLNND